MPRRKLVPRSFPLRCSPLTKITDKLHLFPLCVTGVKLLLSLSFCAGRHSTALWTRAPHLKVAYPAPIITLYWGCMIPKMTSHSEKQVVLKLIFCVAYCLCCDTWSSYFFIFYFKKKGVLSKSCISQGDLFNKPPLHPASPSSITVCAVLEGGWSCFGCANLQSCAQETAELCVKVSEMF